MKHIHIDGLGLEPTALSLGLADLGTKIPENESHRLLDAYVDGGGNFLDTARVYSDWVPGETGRSERILGDWLKATGKRSRVVIATKGAHPRLEAMHVPRLSAKDIQDDLHLSLKTLRVDAIDLYYLHRDDREKPVDEILDTLESCVKAGKILRYACSNWQADRMLEAHACATANGWRGFAANQVHWNMASAHCAGLPDDTCATFNEEMRSAILSTGMAAVAWSSLAHGFFTKLAADREKAAEDKLYHTSGNLRIFNSAHEISRKTGLSMMDIALNYILCQPMRAAAVVGCRTVEQLAEAMGAAEKVLPPDALRALEQTMNGGE